MSMSFNFVTKSIEELEQDLLRKKAEEKNIPHNWESMQDKDQSELERIELMRDELKRDEPVKQESEEREYCFSRSDTL